MGATAVSRDGVPEADDVQGIVLQGYGRLRAAAYVVLRVTDGDAARAWVRSVLPDLTFGGRRPPTGALNLALTASGLSRLGLPPETVAGFSLEFLDGMTSAHRSRLLGDEGDASPVSWSWGGPDDPDVDALLLVFAEDEAALAVTLGRRRADLAANGLEEVAVLDTRDIGRGEHFGFRDGISQPALAGVGARAPADHTVHPGEFLLGYLNEHGQFPRSPLVPASADPGGLLPGRRRGPAGSTAPVEPGEGDAHDFGRNGSYLVLRTLSQDVGGFWRFLDRASGGDPNARTALAARLVGRWPSGAPLTLSPDTDRPELVADNTFGYDADDRYGTRCPLGAHVRRTNPRDTLPPHPGSSASVDVGKRHRLIRRGRSFGEPVEPDQAIAEEPGDDGRRGLHFIALCADIARQFEFVSHTWVMNPSFAGLLDDADPLLGGHGERGRSFTVQREPVRRRIRDVPAFVTVRGGAYFFLPSARALRFLAQGQGAGA